MEYLTENHALLKYEREKWAAGYSYIAGIDEVGRGPLAGPVVAAAVIFPDKTPVPLVNDSKQLTDKKRGQIREKILQVPGIQYSINEVNCLEIDRINILQASRLAMKNAVLSLEKVDFALIDGLPVPDFPVPNQAIVKGDAKSASIAAASILAKIYRDELMDKFALEYPEYAFNENKGYGTKKHLEALEKHGPCPIHRKTFTPVKKALGLLPEQLELF